MKHKLNFVEKRFTLLAHVQRDHGTVGERTLIRTTRPQGVKLTKVSA